MPNNDAVASLAAIAPKAVPTLGRFAQRLSGPVKDAALDASAQAEGGNSGWMRGKCLGMASKCAAPAKSPSSDHLDASQSRAFDAGELSDSIEHIRAADPDIQPVFTDWVSNAEDRHALEQTLEALRLTMIAEERP